MARLNAELDKEAYSQEVWRIIGDPPSERPFVPKAVRDVSSAVLVDTCERIGWTKILNKYLSDLLETVLVGYMLEVSEDWGELDRAQARELADDALRAAQRTRARNGVEQISLDDIDNRLTIMTMGLMSNAPEAVGVREYLFGLAPHQRIDRFAPMLIEVGTGMANVKGRHAEAFNVIQDLSWKIGVGLGLLLVMGEVPDHDRWVERAA